MRRFRDEHALVAFLEEHVGQGALKRVATTNGGEWAGPCPMCGGDDRLRAWPSPREGNPRAWCRQCERSGDALDWATWLAGRDPSARGSTVQTLRGAGYLGGAPPSGGRRVATQRPPNPVSNSAPAPARRCSDAPHHFGDLASSPLGEHAIGVRVALGDRRAWPADARADFEERAAIMEFDGGFDRAEAERLAEASVRAKWASRTDQSVQQGGGS